MMSDQQVRVPVAKIVGKVTCSGFKVKAFNDLKRTSYLATIQPDHVYVLNVQKIWREKGSLFAYVGILGSVPDSPFDSNSEIILATVEEIKEALGLQSDLDKSMNLGKLLDTNIDATFNIEKLGRLFITGRSGSGKSHTVGVIIEELIRKQIGIVILDRHGEYSSLKVLNEEVETPKDSFFDIESPKQAFARNIIEFGDPKINPGVDLGLEYLYASDPQDLVAVGQCTIVNMRGSTISKQRSIVDWLIKNLYNASTLRKIPPFFIFIDEAHELAGKQKDVDVVESVRLIAQEGRKFGMNLVVITQRPQALDVTLRAQAGTWIIHKLTDVNDVNITCKSAEGLTKNHHDETIQMLATGEAIIVGEISPMSPIQIKIRRRYTVHGGAGYNVLDYVSSAEDIQKTELISQLKNRINLDNVKRISGQAITSELDSRNSKLKELNSLYKEEIKELKSELKSWKGKFKKEKKRADDAVKIAEKTLKELKKR